MLNQNNDFLLGEGTFKDGTTLYKRCLSCNKAWGSRIDFLTDAKVTLTGYQANFTDLEDGRFIFEHNCGNRIAVMVRELSDLYGGPIFEERKTGREGCPELCLHGDNISPCPQPCECAYVREILQLFAGPIEGEQDL